MTIYKSKLAKQIRNSEKTRKAVQSPLTTDERVLARITDGIYRQPSSALRELISNAYDADATEVIILTDAPRFSQISVRDDGLGLSPETLQHLIEHIGGSAKNSEEGKELGVTSKKDSSLSPGGRQLIGKLGIGLFSVSQFTRHFLVITKTKGDEYRTIADITLGPISGQKEYVKGRPQEIKTGSARIWREYSADKNSHGTEIKLLELLPRTKAELSSDDLWLKLQLEKEDDETSKTKAPLWHIGRMKPKQNELLEILPKLPWDENDTPKSRFKKLINAVRDAAESGSDSVDLNTLFDHYLQTLWTLSLSAPLEYLEGHPFDLEDTGEFKFFQLENATRGQAQSLHLKKNQTVRKVLGLNAPDGATGKNTFTVTVDGVELFRPILYRNLPKTQNAVTTPLFFIGHEKQKFAKKPIQLSGGPLIFEAYLFWSPRIIPNQHQGVVIRVGNASGTLFDRTFMGYQISEQTRLRQITIEIFVLEGLEEAINIDRESFNYAHPHYQYIVKWLHSAIRQFTNRHKEIGKQARTRRLETVAKKTREEIESKVEASLKELGVEDIPEVVLLEPDKQFEMRKLRNQGVVALRKELVVPESSAKLKTDAEKQRQKLAEKKAVGIVQLLHGWGLLKGLSYEEQEELIRGILDIVLLKD